MGYLQNINKRSVQNWTTFGRKLQKGVKTMRTEGLVFSSEELADALVSWSNGYLRKAVLQNDNKEIMGYGASFDVDNRSYTHVVLDEQGMATTVDIGNRFNTYINFEYANKEHACKKQSLNMEPYLGSFKKKSLIAGMKNTELKAVAENDNIIIHNLDDALSKGVRGLKHIPKTTSGTEVLSFLFEPVKNYKDVDLLRTFELLSMRDGWKPTDDNYIDFLTKLSKSHIGKSKNIDEALAMFLKSKPAWSDDVTKTCYKLFKTKSFDAMYAHMFWADILNYGTKKLKLKIVKDEQDGFESLVEGTKCIHTRNREIGRIFEDMSFYEKNKNELSALLDHSTNGFYATIFINYLLSSAPSQEERTRRANLILEAYPNEENQMPLTVLNDISRSVELDKISEEANNTIKCSCWASEKKETGAFLLYLSQSNIPATLATDVIRSMPVQNNVVNNLYLYENLINKLDMKYKEMLCDIIFDEKKPIFIDTDVPGENASSQRIYLVRTYIADSWPDVDKHIETIQALYPDDYDEQLNKLKLLYNSKDIKNDTNITESISF